MSSFKLLGVNSDQETCDCCGKTGLKRVIWLQPLDHDGCVNGRAVAYGSSCAAIALSYRDPKTSGTKARVERDAFVAMQETVRRRQAAARKSFVVYVAPGFGKYLFPGDLAAALASGALTLREAVAERTRRVPILDDALSTEKLFSLSNLKGPL